MNTSDTPLHRSRRIVIKVGSLLMADAATGLARHIWLAALAQDIQQLRARGAEVIIVTSGAVALGRSQLKLGAATLRLEEKQAAAACGQMVLMQAWQQALGVHALPVAQLLITAEDTEDRRRYLNARTTLETLLEGGVIPIINENDTVTTAEIRYGDNDRLAARVAAMASADVLVLLSDIDGLYDADPKVNPAATRIARIDTITPELEQMAGGAGDALSSGGMRTKLMAAQIAMSAGCHMAIASGLVEHPLHAMLEGANCSWFIAKESPLNARKHWIANAIGRVGKLHLDEGAAQAVVKGNSLLPIGVKQCEGEWDRGDVVALYHPAGQLIAYGICRYSSHETVRIIGQKSDAIEQILGYKRRNELVHCDDMVSKL